MNEHVSPPPTEQSCSTQYLIPPHLSHLIKDRPLLWYENGDDYDALLASVFAELDPKGAVEAILVKDVVDYIWEARRMRRLKSAAIHAELPRAAADLMRKDYQEEHDLDYSEARERLEYGVRAAWAGEKDWQEHLDLAMKSSHVTCDVMLYEAYKHGLKPVSAIADELERLERRRDQILRSLREQRAALAAMARSLVTRDEAEVVAVNPADQAG